MVMFRSCVHIWDHLQTVQGKHRNSPSGLLTSGTGASRHKSGLGVIFSFCHYALLYCLIYAKCFFLRGNRKKQVATYCFEHNGARCDEPERIFATNQLNY